MILKEISKSGKKDGDKILRFDRAKTIYQMGRNGALMDAERDLKKRFPTKKIKIVWLNKTGKSDKA